jgi:plastocyanin
MGRGRIVCVAVAALALVAGGCGDDSDDGGGGEALDVTAVDYAFQDLPEEIDGGTVTVNLTNEGEAQHEIAFVQIGDTPIDQFFEDFPPVITEGAPYPDYVTYVVGANEAAPGGSGTFTYTLPAGTYAAFCALTGTPEDPEGEDGAPHFAQGMQQLVTVTGEEDPGDLPDADGTITASDYTYESDVSAGDTTINFVNDGPNQDHFAAVLQFPEGTSVEDAEAAFAAFLESEDGSVPDDVVPPEDADFAFSGIASNGLGVQFEVEGGFDAGTYVYACFMTDREGGPPHAVGAQMYKGFVVE